MKDSAEVDARLAALYGEVDWAGATGLLHVAAIEAASRRAIIPGPAAPRSDTDRFVLCAARARADSILTSGAILREEPGLVHDAGSSPGSDAVFRAWRRSRLGKDVRPSLVVLSGSGRFPLDHPALHAAPTGFVLTTESGASSLPPRIGSLDIVIGNPALSPLAAAVSVLSGAAAVEELAPASTILVEAGPRTSAALYAQGSGEGLRCDELLLSRFLGSVDPQAEGPNFVSAEQIEACFPHGGASRSETAHRDGSGEWTFNRYRAN